MFGVVGDYYRSKQKGKQYKQNISPKSYKTEIKMTANPGLTRPRLVCALTIPYVLSID